MNGNPAKKSKGPVVLAILTIVLGIGWLLTVMEVVPGIDWVWVLSLAVVGILIMVLGGINKVTFVVGPFLLISTVFSLLRQTGRLSEKVEIPCLVIAGGVLALLAWLLPLPTPAWLEEPPTEKK